MRIEVMGIPFDNVDMEEAVQGALTLIERPGAAYGVTPNSEIVYEAMQDEELREILCQADLILPDGAGVVLGAKILGTPLKQKVAGIDFIDQLMSRLEHTDKTFYFLGSKPGVAEAAVEKLHEKYPELKVCGTQDGYFKEEGPVIAAINEKKPDVLLVCLGAPKQEKFMWNHREELQVGLMLGLGGSLDSFAGNVKRAPKWMIRCNLEWFYRLIKEPWRLGRMMRLPKFLWLVILRRLKG
jgi:N-acetylglucosaminyldiphosphoundecaprenol N-acetyl-beta-D-mannosaminyltransferase